MQKIKTHYVYLFFYWPLLPLFLRAVNQATALLRLLATGKKVQNLKALPEQKL